MQSYNKSFNRQISETPGQRSMLDNFFDLKMGGREFGSGSLMSSSSSSSGGALKLQDGVFTIKVDTQDFR